MMIRIIQTEWENRIFFSNQIPKIKYRQLKSKNKQNRKRRTITKRDKTTSTTKHIKNGSACACEMRSRIKILNLLAYV